MVILVSLLACVFLFANSKLSSAISSAPANSDAGFLSLAGLLPDSPQISPADRPIFPYSIIPGGARSSRELQSVLAIDPVAAHHYSDFRVHSVSLVRLPTARKVYVSYRIGNRIFWTKEKVTLHAGEPVLTDGTHLARARCGNRISLLPGPTSSSEPTASVLGAPVFSSRFPATPEMLSASPVWPISPFSPEILSVSSTPPLPPGIGPGPVGPGGGGYIPQPFYPPSCCGITTPGGSGGLPQPPPYPPPIIIPPGAPTPAPEPLAFTLLCVGSLVLFLILKIPSR
jgi:hypothetical protein